MLETVTVGPFGVFFTNRNRAMNLRGHSHTAEVTVTFRNTRPDAPGFPSFATTNARLREQLAAAAFVDDPPAEVLAFDGCAFDLWELELAVRGVRDAIGHDDSFTRYRIQE